jgi:deoxyribose-phosphate aldolase
MDMELLVQKITEEVVRKLTGETGSTVAAAAPKGNSVLGAIDHTLLKPDATVEQVKKVCDEAKEHKFASVCVNPSYIGYVAQQLQGTSVKPCVVIGFPLGATMPEVKAYETKACIAQGAKEVDMVINIGAAKTGHWSLVQKDIEEVVNAARGKALVKVIIETCLLTDDEKVKACNAAKAAGADFVKTSTGFSTGGATEADVSLMRKTVGPGMGVKASGGVRDYDSAMKMINAGANRLGTSNGVSIAKALAGDAPVAASGCINCGKCASPCPTGNVSVVQSY